MVRPKRRVATRQVNDASQYPPPLRRGQPQADGNQPLDRNDDPDGVKLQLGITQKGLTGFVVACDLSDFLGSNIRVQF